MTATQKYKIRKNGSKIIGTENKNPSMTDQSFKAECDVNNIIRHYKKTGQLNHINKKQGVYADLSEIPDLMQASQIVQNAQETFMQLPAETRKHFDNDPIKMMDFIKNPENTKKAIELGLLTAKSVLPEPDLKKTLNELNETLKSQKASKKDVSKAD